MPKSTRKRKHEDPIECEIDVPKQKHRPYDETTQAEDDQLHKILFGGSTFLKSLEEAEKEDIKGHDSGLGETDSDHEMEHASTWSDDDKIDIDQVLDCPERRLLEGTINDNKYKNLLRHTSIESINRVPSWACLDRPEEDSDEDNEILQTCGFTKRRKSLYLPRSILEYKKVRDLNFESYNEGPCITAIEFFQESSTALVAGQRGIATLYAIDNKKNTKLHSIRIENFPIFSANILENNNEVLFGSRHAFINCFDLMSSKLTSINLPPGLTNCKKCSVSSDQTLLAIAGKWGEIHLLSTRTKERVGILKQNSDVTALSFGFGNDLLYAHSNSGEITIFDVRMRHMKHKFIDNGCLQGTTLAISPSNRFLAAGSAQGVVNIYNTNSLYHNENPKSEKVLMHLTTKISSLAFNSTSELLGYASCDIPNSVKLYHLPSQTAYKNFPLFQTKLGNINVMNFSPNSGYLAFGNNKSTASLFRLGHYKIY